MSDHRPVADRRGLVFALGLSVVWWGVFAAVVRWGVNR